MGDSPDIFGDQPASGEDEAPPTTAELEAAGQSALFGDAPATPPPPSQPAVAQPYRVLARKYRPKTFGELIGQEAMVRTLANAIRRDRLAHAFLMTGVRGVGKTSTARLIAKALNCIGPDGKGGPTIDPCGQCEPCVAIAEGRHIDVIEMDAASHTGVDDVREIIEAVRYAAVSARYKIYIIDEVHMLSRNAFNALLKTLEEPPAHVKFLFATTEADKLPVTVLSRCQRFDLRRIETPVLTSHFAAICAKEGVDAEEEALAMIAAAAEGSVRDGLSILDQAIAHADLDGEGRVLAAQVRDMLGLADKSVQRGLFAALLGGDGPKLLELVSAQFALGVEPLALLRGALEITHRVTVAQIGGGVADAASAEEREALAGWAKALSAGQLHRLWQLLLRGFEEVRLAPDPLIAAQMALLRVMHASDMPDPGTLIKKLEHLASQPVRIQPADGAPSTATAAAPAPQDSPPWEALVQQLERACGLGLASRLRMQVRVVELAQGVLRFTQPPGFREDLVPEIRDGLLKLTGERWTVERCDAEGLPTLVEQAEVAKASAEEAIRRAPLVEAVMDAFPGAQLLNDEEPAPYARSGGRNWSNRR
ncbi:MAG TPA: DNA polymerase III subunit gamma/tau [Novosphingobium sp.]